MSAGWYPLVEGRATLGVGDCRELLRALPGASVDSVVTDPPYDDHTHGAVRRGCTGFVERPGRKQPIAAQFSRTRDLGFAPMTPDLMNDAALQFARLTKRWVLVFCSLEMISDWRAALEFAGLQYVRAQIWHKLGSTPQFTGDRPAQACEAIITAHRPGKKRWNAGGKHGFYEYPIVLNRGGKNPRFHTAQKPLELMQELVRRFSDEGETILDPFAGSGTTGVAALAEGRKFIGCELEPESAAIAARRIQAAWRERDALTSPKK